MGGSGSLGSRLILQKNAKRLSVLHEGNGPSYWWNNHKRGKMGGENTFIWSYGWGKRGLRGQSTAQVPMTHTHIGQMN